MTTTRKFFAWKIEINEQTNKNNNSSKIKTHLFQLNFIQVRFFVISQLMDKQLDLNVMM